MPTDSNDTADVGKKTSLCERLVEDVVEGKVAFEDFGDKLRGTGITVDEGKEYFSMPQQRLQQ
jgi:hypothetical protein